MKKGGVPFELVVVLAVLVILAVLLVGATEIMGAKRLAEESQNRVLITAIFGTEVVPGVFDNDEGVMFIEHTEQCSDKHYTCNIHEEMMIFTAEISKKIFEWQKLFPQKRIVAMSSVVVNFFIRGQLIYYENADAPDMTRAKEDQ